MQTQDISNATNPLHTDQQSMHTNTNPLSLHSQAIIPNGDSTIRPYLLVVHQVKAFLEISNIS